MREVHESRVRANGVELAVFDWPGAEPAAFLAHATGFHARCWDQVVEHLPGRRCIALDMRGHGRSEKPAPPYRWLNFGRDVAALVEEMGLRDAVGVGHSKGGHAVTYAAAHVPRAFRALLLVDPVIMARETYHRPPAAQEHFAARRRNEWASPHEMYERFKDRPPFNNWAPAVLWDYCNHGLLPAPGGEGFVLACPPEVEAATYAGSAGADIYEEIAAIEIPVRVLRAKPRTEGGAMDMSSSPTTPDLASRFRRGTDVPLPEYTHFIPMEAPALVARHIEELAAE
ncbi:MAG: alpha/beta hydrolase [Chloroflexi bacterium]|nr:alpha/beta hydrolase [Chloroflexota bacterium]